MGMSESLITIPDVRKKLKISSRDSNSARNEKFSLLLKGSVDPRKSKERTFKIPKLQNYQSATHLSHRHPASSVWNTIDVLKVSDFKNEKKFSSKSSFESANQILLFRLPQSNARHYQYFWIYRGKAHFRNNLDGSVSILIWDKDYSKQFPPSI